MDEFEAGFIRLNKALIKLVGLQSAVLYCELLSKKKYFENKGQLSDEGYFFNTVENLEEDTGLTRHQQIPCINKLEGTGLIKCIRKGVPSKRYFYVAENQCYPQSTENRLSSQPKIGEQVNRKSDGNKNK